MPSLRCRVTQSTTQHGLLTLRLAQPNTTGGDLKRALMLEGFKDGDEVLLTLAPFQLHRGPSIADLTDEETERLSKDQLL